MGTGTGASGGLCTATAHILQSIPRKDEPPPFQFGPFQTQLRPSHLQKSSTLTWFPRMDTTLSAALYASVIIMLFSGSQRKNRDMRRINQGDGGYGGAGQILNRSRQKDFYRVTGHDRLHTFASSKANVLVYIFTFASMFTSASAPSKANVLVYGFTTDSILLSQLSPPLRRETPSIVPLPLPPPSHSPLLSW